MSVAQCHRTVWLAVVLCGVWPAASGQDSPLSSDYDQQTRQAVERGLAWLARCQQPSGAWTCKVGYKLNENYYGEDGEHVGVTSIICMAYMANGNFPDRGKYAKTVAKALEFVLNNVRSEDGYITANGTRMYSHAFATLFLAHMCGMTRRADVREKLKRAVNLLVQAQNKEGGWRYQPQPIDADLSVTVSVLQGLRAARNVGIGVPMETIERASKYVKECATQWGFKYQNDKTYTFNDVRITYALTAAGVVSLNSAGIYEGAEVKSGLNRLRNYHELQWGKYHYFYGHYYACQAMYRAGGELWREYYTRLKSDILSHQDDDGGWTDDVGRTYATGMACLILQIPFEWFPIFQK